MASIFEKKDRHVIPNWRSFDNTAKLGELNGSKGIQLHSSFKPDISDLLDDWENNSSMGVAGDLLGVALLANQEDNPIVKKIAKYVIVNAERASPAILKAARLVNESKSQEVSIEFDQSMQSFDQNHIHNLHAQISAMKKKLRENTYNPILWIEISRLYAILGQDKKAERSIRNAIFLAPENRFVLRNSARFFTHLGDFEFAHDIIRRSELVKTDPWLMASEISLATLRDRGSKFMKLGLQIVESNNLHPFNISELASSLATVELKNHSIKRSRKLFEKSLVNPNDNSLAQAEWAEQQEITLMQVNPSQFTVVNSFEAHARDAVQHKRWNDAIRFSMHWFLDMPFSKTAIAFGNEVAFRNLKDHGLAVQIAQAGLVSHPHDPQLINNIIYSLCIENRLGEAEGYFSRLRKDDIPPKGVHEICLTATTGMFNFRKGNYDVGRSFYLYAMQIAKEIKDSYLNNLAFVNYCREEARVGEIDVSVLLPKLKMIANRAEADTDLAEQVTELIKVIEQNPLIELKDKQIDPRFFET